MNVSTHYHIGTYDLTGCGRTAYTREHRILSDHHRHMLEMESGISPEIIADRGYWTASTAAEIPPGFAPSQYQTEMFPVLVIPQWNTVGRQAGYVLRPDHPRLNEDGKPIKYESMPGGPVGFDCPPSMVHLLRDPSITIHITEGSKKADAMASRGLLCLSLNGVYGFLHKRVVVSELDEMETEGRRILPAFDSDVTVKPEVVDALDRLARAANRRGARVEIVYLPAGPDGAKVGLDDYFAAGGTVEGLDKLTRPWTPISAGPSYEELTAENVILRRRVDFWQGRAMQAEQRALEAEARDDAKHELILNTHLDAVPRAVLYNLVMQAEEVAEKRIDTPTEVVISLAKVCNDFRRKGQSGYNDNGTKPITARKNAKTILETHIANGTINARIQDRIRTNEDGQSYSSHDVILVLDDTTVGALRRIATWEPEEKKATRGPNIVPQPCEHCGKVECRIQRTTCAGCGQEVADPKVLPALMGPEGEGEKFSPVTRDRPVGKTVPRMGPELEGEKSSPNTSKRTGEDFSPSLLPPHSPATQWLFDQLLGGMRSIVDVGNAATAVGFDRGAIREAREELGVEAIQVPRDSRLYLRLPTATHSGASERQASA